MSICQLGMHKNVQDHTNANVCKQTYDASCITKGTQTASVHLGKARSRSLANHPLVTSPQSMHKLTLTLAFAASFVCSLQRACCQVSLPSACVKLSESDTNLSCTVLPYGGLTVDYDAEHSNLCSRNRLQCSSTTLDLACWLFHLFSETKRCYPSSTGCNSVNTGATPTFYTAEVSIQNFSSEQAVVNFTLGGYPGALVEHGAAAALKQSTSTNTQTVNT